MITREIVEYLMALDVKEIHGYEPAFGLRVFTATAVAAEENRINGRRNTPQENNEKELPHDPDRITKRTLRGLSDIRLFFHRNETPIYFISATNFNLIGIDEWVRNFKCITYIDCFDGQHPNVFVPSEIPHKPFTSIEDINNYLLQHKEVVDFIRGRAARRRGGQGRVPVLRRGDGSSCANSSAWKSAFPRPACGRWSTTRSRRRESPTAPGSPACPMCWPRSTATPSLREASASLGEHLVIQTAFGDSGHTTFFISSEADYNKYADEIAKEPEVKIMKRIRCRGAAQEACVTRHGTIVGPLDDGTGRLQGIDTLSRRLVRK